jgi:hypothetical protein
MRVSHHASRFAILIVELLSVIRWCSLSKHIPISSQQSIDVEYLQPEGKVFPCHYLRGQLIRAFSSEYWLGVLLVSKSVSHSYRGLIGCRNCCLPLRGDGQLLARTCIGRRLEDVEKGDLLRVGYQERIPV